MANNIDFIEYICEKINKTGMITSKKMFGEHMIYVNAKPVLLVCNNTVYVKMLDELKQLMEGSETGNPYNGAKVHYILDIDNIDLTNKVVSILETIIPVPKPRANKKI